MGRPLSVIGCLDTVVLYIQDLALQASPHSLIRKFTAVSDWRPILAVPKIVGIYISLAERMEDYILTLVGPVLLHKGHPSRDDSPAPGSAETDQ